MELKSTLKKTVDLLTPQEKKRGFLVLLLVVGMALFETAGVASVMPFLAVLGDPRAIDTNQILKTMYGYAQGFGVRSASDFLVTLGIGAFILIILSAAYRTLTLFAINRYIQMRRHSIGTRLLETYLHQPYDFFIGRHSSEMNKTILSEVDQLIGNVLVPGYGMIAYGFVLIAISILLIVVNPWLALLAAGVLGGLYLAVYLVLKNRLRRLGRLLVAANKERFMAVSEALGGIKEIKLIGCERCYLTRFQGSSRQYAVIQASHQTINQMPKYMIEAVAFGGIIAIVIIMMVAAGGLDNNVLGQILPILGLYAFSAYRLQPALQMIFQGVASLQYGKASVDIIHADLRQNNKPVSMLTEEIKPLKAFRKIELKHLSYFYPNANKAAIVDLNLEIPVGSAIGLIGSTGAGKTTLVDLILGLLRPSEGAITVDDIPVTESTLSAWQQSLGYVPQDIFLTDASIAENIAFGIPRDQIDEEQIIHCAHMAQLHNFILKELPAQYETNVGERGVRLSGGQRQRIGIARALYHNPEVLVFDEATSALDTVTERAVMDAIETLAHQKTIIIIAHRLSTVRKCDQIVLLQNGRIKEKGCYSELLLNSPDFQNMAGTTL